MRTYGNSPNGNEPNAHDGESWQRGYRRERRTAKDELEQLAHDTTDDADLELLKAKLAYAINQAVNRLPIGDYLDRMAQQQAPRAYLLEPGESLRVSWGFDEAGQPLDLVYLDREWLADPEDNDPAGWPDLEDISVTDTALDSLDADVPDTVPDWMQE